FCFLRRLRHFTLFFFTAAATSEIYTLSLHDALPIYPGSIVVVQLSGFTRDVQVAITQLILWDAWYYQVRYGDKNKPFPVVLDERSEEHTSELQSRENLVCRLLLEKKKKIERLHRSPR